MSCFQENVAPEDLRVLDSDTQILTLTLDKAFACQNQPADSAVDEEILT